MTIKEVNGIKKIYNNRKLLGTVSKFCCGVDFRPKSKKCVISILKVKMNSEDLFFCIEKIITLEIPNKLFYFNFNKETAKSEEKMKKYQKALNELP